MIQDAPRWSSPKESAHVRPMPRGEESWDEGSGVWKPVGLHSWIGHGCHRRPHQIRDPPGSEASWAHSSTKARTVRIRPSG
eukprot:4166495-Pyramimonas_sp.AAC.1